MWRTEDATLKKKKNNDVIVFEKSRFLFHKKLRFDRICLGGRPNRTEKNAFSDKNRYMWTGKNDSQKMLVHGEMFEKGIFCFAFSNENGYVWSEPN